MNVVEAQGIVESFGKVGFRNVQYGPLWNIANHYSQSNCRLMVLASHTAQQDLCFAHIFFGASEMPVFILTDFANPFKSFFANNVQLLVLDPDGNNTAKIIDKLRKNQNFVLLFAISKPGFGRIRSGYFHIAQQLQLPIIVGGFDYHQQNCYVSKKRWDPPKRDVSYAEFQSSTELELTDELTQICPLYPKLQVAFDEHAYRAQNPEFDSANIEQQELALLIDTVHGNSVSKQEMLVIITVTVIIIIAFVIVYIIVPFVKKHKTKEEIKQHEP